MTFDCNQVWTEYITFIIITIDEWIYLYINS